MAAVPAKQSGSASAPPARMPHFGLQALPLYTTSFATESAELCEASVYARQVFQWPPLDAPHNC